MRDGLKIALLGSVVLIALGAFWYFGRDEDGDELAGRRVETEEFEQEVREISIPRRVADRGTSVPDLAAEETPEELRDVEEKAASTALGQGLELTIEVAIVGLHDEPWPDQDGQIRIQLDRPEDQSSRIVETEVKEGLCRIEVKAGEYKLYAQKMTVGEAERIARNQLVHYVERADFGDGRCRVKLQILPRVMLHVLAKNDRREVRKVRVLRPTEWEHNDRHPGNFTGMRLIAEGDSPVAIDVQEHGTHSTYWVVAPGHAATAAHFDRASDGHRIIVIEDGGSIDVTIDGDPAGVPKKLLPTLRLRDSAPQHRGEAFSELAWEGKRQLTLEHLPAGDYKLALESGDAWQEPVVVAEEDTKVFAGESTRCVLAPDLSPLRVTLAAVSGKIVLPPGGIAEDYVQVEYRPAEPRPGHPTPRAWISSSRNASKPTTMHLGAVYLVPGSYVATVLGQKFPVEVPPEGRDDLVFQLEKRESVAIYLRHPGSDEIVRNAHLSWYADGQNGNASWSEEKKAYIASPPTGSISMHVWCNDYFHDVQVERAVGQGRIDIELRLQQAFSLVLKCKDLVIPHSFELGLKIETADGKNVNIRSAHSDGDTITRNLDSPGRYRITVTGAPAGYRAMNSVDFEVKAGETKEVLVELVAEP